MVPDDYRSQIRLLIGPYVAGATSVLTPTTSASDRRKKLSDVRQKLKQLRWLEDEVARQKKLIRQSVLSSNDRLSMGAKLTTVTKIIPRGGKGIVDDALKALRREAMARAIAPYEQIESELKQAKLLLSKVAAPLRESPGASSRKPAGARPSPAEPGRRSPTERNQPPVHVERKGAVENPLELLRDRILRTIFEHEQTRAGEYLSDSVIAHKVGATVSDASYHLDVLAEEGYVTLATSTTSNSARLTTSGMRRVREGTKASPQRYSPTIGTVINAPHGNIQSVATNQGGTQIVNIRGSSERNAELDRLIERLGRELEAADLAGDAKDEATADIQALQVEARRKQPKLQRVKEYVDQLTAIAGPVATTVLEIYKLVNSIHG